MWKDALRALETGALGEIGLVAFVVAFVLVVVYAMTLPKRNREHLKNLPLDDGAPERAALPDDQ
jgi:cbb3-type cytochrome oxidase subunit 3